MYTDAFSIIMVILIGLLTWDWRWTFSWVPFRETKAGMVGHEPPG